MKASKFLKVLTFSLLVFITSNLQAQDFPDLDKSPMDVASFPSNYKVSDKLIKVIYSRPQLKGRELLTLVPNSDVWRTGANEATEVVLYKSMNFGDTKVKAGTYSLFTIPGEKEWIVILSNDTNVWGAYTYNKSNDVARVTVPVKESKNFIETFSMAFEETSTGATLYMGWGNVVVAVPFTK